MIDSIQNGTGNSRWLKSNVPANITFAELIAQLRAGTLPIDLGAVNPAGWAVLGDPLNKETLLSNPTAALYGLPNTAVPDSVFSLLSSMVKEKGAYVVGTYTGTYIGMEGEDGRQNIALGFRPKAVLIGGVSGFDDSPGNSGNTPTGGLVLDNFPNVYERSSATITSNGFSIVQARGSGDFFTVNYYGRSYRYLAFK